jgi:hypothetical protein
MSVWGHNISRSRATGFTPFRLLYGKDAITPEELKLGSFQTQIEATTPIQRYVKIEMIKTSWLRAADNLDAYHAETRAWRDKKVVRKGHQPRRFSPHPSSGQARKAPTAMVRPVHCSKQDQTRYISADE